VLDTIGFGCGCPAFCCDAKRESIARAADVKRLASIHEFGMEPDVIAARVLEAMREVCDEILQDFRD